ncbi:MAG TPA: hypothetical protein VKB02_11130 [Pyrinomonadaceae bacterium]|nr:hypothetical protein [Pyrinomonadaceae bacterium]
MSARAPRRLPGFRFETQAPPLPEVLPRMDIAVFVGFAASGPLQTPVAVESEPQFVAIFGEDAPLAWDLVRGEEIHAHLGPAVRAFFRNGGQRCWIIRVARQSASEAQPLNRARYNYFPIPYLARAEFNPNGQLSSVTPAFARGRSEGSWSDALRVSSALLSRPIQVNGALQRDGVNYALQIARDPSNPLAAGDMLRLVYESTGLTALLALQTIETVEPSPLVTPFSPFVNATASRAVWLLSLSNDSLAPAPNTPVTAAVFTREQISSPPNAEDNIAAFEITYSAVLSPDQPTLLIDDKITLKLLDCPLADAPQPGAIVRIDQGGNRWWMTVDSLGFTSGDDGVPLLSGSAFRVVNPPDPLPVETPAGERLSFEIWLRQAEEYSISLGDLGFAPDHERFWAKLPTDEEVYRPSESITSENPATLLWKQVGDLFRFPLAGPGAADEIYFPLFMPGLPENYLGPVSLPGGARERDGLAEFDAALFLDRDLVDIGAANLATTADFLQYLSPRPRRLTGMHAAFPLEEVTIIAVPDAVHSGWVEHTREPLVVSEPSAPLLRPEWWHFLDCNPAPKQKPSLSSCDPEPPEPSPIKPVHEPEWGNFLNCSIQIIGPPQLFAFPQFSSDGNITLRWELSPPQEADYVVEESSQPNFSDAATVYSGTTGSFTLYGRRTGDYYYRVRAIIGADTSDWSNGVAVRVEDESRWIIDSKDYSPDVLLAVQRSLLRFCAARGDLFGVLSLPEHYREDKAIEHTNLLRATPSTAPPTAGVSALGPGEVNAFSYGAVYHPWLIGREAHTDAVISTPPCGAISGSIAESALNRGAWIAPANQPLRGVVALKPSLLPERHLALQDALINVVRQEPRGFLVLDSDTLRGDEDLQEISVRRLLILLRRLALQLGVTYVFEPNSTVFRRAVDRGFTEMLDGMFERGAFAGATPATSYQVVTDDSLNTPQSVDVGRFIVELRVAPSLPMRFLTIRLVQTSDRTQALEVI